MRVSYLDEIRLDFKHLLPSLMPQVISAPRVILPREIGVEPWGDGHHVGFGTDARLPRFVRVVGFIPSSLRPCIPADYSPQAPSAWRAYAMKGQLGSDRQGRLTCPVSDVQLGSPKPIWAHARPIRQEEYGYSSSDCPPIVRTLRSLER